ncbi:restriction endonuclease subunit S [Salmonella enterica]|uniref:restriction endonuclease subunit S n=1 Tax=Salmonella enterica TaxID=28901 RepID=UPI000BA10EB9|nr:restriction endonuclease subunit S [Salmonella enterica]EAA9276477.1 restriction endonuclease subunit S [Salmonella enterica]EAU1485947.1 restriction endonuclease subunit S [Salmonella enterica]OZU41345.1 restriction endonuclease [Salmonella enterica subsp. enterica serovar Ekotedo]
MSALSYLEKLLDGVDVQWKTIGEVISRTSNIKWREVTRSYRYVDLTSVDIETKKITETTEIIANNAPSRAQKLLEENDVIFATTRPTQQRFCLIDSEYSGEVASTGYCVLRAKQDEVLPKWILHWISTSYFKKYVEENQSGSAYPAISDARVKECLIPIPCPDNPEKSLAIQSEIVRILDTFTALTAELTAELSTRKKQYNYYRDQLLSFKDGEIEWKTLGDITKLITKGTTPKKFVDDGVNFIKLESFENNRIKKDKFMFIPEVIHLKDLKRSILEANDILFAIAGATIGKCAVVDETLLPANTNQALAIIRTSEMVNVRFVFYYMQTRAMKEYIAKFNKTSAQPNLNLNQMSNFKIPVPSIEEQLRIVSILDKFDALTSSISEGLPREIELRQKQYEYYRDLLFSFPKPEVTTD